MRKQSEAATPTHLTAYQLADRWHMHPATLANWRVEGEGPKFIKLGRKVLYSLTEIEAWEEKNLKKSTVG